MEEVSEPEGDTSKEIVEEQEKMEGPSTEAVASGDADRDAAENGGELAAGDSSTTNEEKHVIDASDAAETAGASELDAANESAVTTTDAAVEDTPVGILEVATEDSMEMAMQAPDETVTAVGPSTVDEMPESDKSDAKAAAVTTTDRVERVTSKADKVTVSVEAPKTDDDSKTAVANAAVSVDTAAVTKAEASDAAAVNQTTPDVMKMAGNDELKFGVLIGLVRVGQLSNKDVVDSVLCLVC